MKKLTAMLLSVMMLTVAVLQGTVFAAFSDVADDNPYKNAITTLNTLSVIDGYEDGTFKPDGAITRTEFTKLIVFILGLQDLTYPNYSFEDVEQGFWGSNFIQTAYDRGIIAGFDDGLFHPQEPVTYAQALKMVVCTLGYENFATALNIETEGWADKYIQEANQLGLTKGIQASGYYADATRGMIAQLLYNALEIEMYENNGYNWIKTEKTLMKDYLKVKELKGTLVGVEDNVTEECSYKLLEQQMDILTNAGEEVLIDFSDFTQNSNDISKYLGSTIKVYYRQVTDNDERTLLSIDAETIKNSVMELKYDDLNGISGTTLKYFDGDSKTKTIKLKSDDLTVRYNGKLVSSGDTVTLGRVDYTRQEALEQWLTPESDNYIYGSVKLTDSGNDGTYDMIQIYDYDTIVALSAPSTSDYRITDKMVTGNYLILDPQSAEYTYTITKNDAEIPVTSIAANDVILYAKSLDGEHYTLLVSNKTVTGSISAMSSDGNRMTISGNTYDIGEKCADYIKEKNNKELKAGVSGTFYLDAMGTAVFGTIQETAAAPYAYITNAFYDYEEGGKYYITVYAPSTNASEASSYPLKSNVKVNGSNTKAESAYNKIKEAAKFAGDETSLASQIYGAGKTPENMDYAQPARVKIANNEVTEIVILTSGDEDAQNEDNEKIVKYKDIGQYTYSTNSFTQGGKTIFSVNSATTVIYVPQDRSKKTGYARRVPSSAFTSGESYYIEAYDLNSSRIAGLVILYGNDGTLTKVKKDTDFSIVADYPVDEYNDKKDETVQKLELYTGAANTTRAWYTYDRTEFNDVIVGDVIQFAYDNDNLIQGRINNIKFNDVARVLDGKDTYKDQLYNWEETLEPGEDNNYQTMKFDYRFKKPGTSDDELYSSSTLGMVPNSRAAVFNVSQVLTDENKLYVTKGGFREVDGAMKIDDEDYEEINVTSSTKIIRMEPERDEISRYVADTTSDLTINDFRDAKNYGVDCSKILVLLSKGNAKLILIYN